MENVFNGFMIATGAGLMCREWKFALMTGGVAAVILFLEWLASK